MRIASWLFLVICVIVSICFYLKLGRTRFTFYGDALGYYCYLPATFIYHNLGHFDSLPAGHQVPERIANSLHDMATPNALSPKGYYIDQYTCGVALLQYPFFLAAHYYAQAHGLVMSGYSEPYEYALRYGAMFYSALGLVFIFLSVKRLFDADIARWVIAILLIATNLFWFTFVQAGMAHQLIFMLFAVLVYLTPLFYEKPRWWLSLLMGLISGLIVVMRPSDIILVMFIPLYGIQHVQDIQKRMHWCLQHKYHLLFMILMALIPMLPQLLYWYTYTGHIFYDSYRNQSFVWSFKNTGKGLWGCNNGWLFYSPIMIISLLGMLLFRVLKNYAATFLVVLPIYVFVIYSWWCYTYINGFGSRPMIHVYPVLAFPLAAAIQWVFKQSLRWTFFLMLFIGVCAYANVAWSRHQMLDFITTEQTHRYHIWTMLSKLETSYDDIVRADAGRQPDYEKQQVVGTLKTMDFEDTNLKFIATDERDSNNHFLRLPQGEEWPPFNFYWLYDATKARPKQWLRISGQFLTKTGWTDTYTSQDFRFEIAKRATWVNCRIPNKIGRAHEHGITLHSAVSNQWGEVFFYARIPSNIEEGDSIKVVVHNNSKEELWMDDLKLELTEMK